MVVPTGPEGELAHAYLACLDLRERPALLGVSREDEMYIHLRKKLPRPEFALQQYLFGGLEAVRVVDNVLAATGRSLEDLRSFLDFACGYGKSTRFLVKRVDTSRVWVSDIYAEAVDFQRRHLGVHGIVSAADPSEVSFGRRFEVVYAGSLFSHLPEAAFRKWLKALYDLLDDDGLLVLSTQGETVQPFDEDSAEKGFLFVPVSESRSLAKQQYGSTTVSERWVRELASELGIAQVAFLPRELWAQDVFVFARNSNLGLIRPNAYPRGNIEGASIDDQGRLLASGWAVDFRHGAPISSVRLQLQDHVIGEATLSGRRPDVATHYGEPAFERSGWSFEAHITKPRILSPGQVLKVRLRSAAGVETCLVERLSTK